MILKFLIQIYFASSSRKSAAQMLERQKRAYLQILNELTDEQAAKPIRVPSMRGVDEDMRDWSFYALLEHNAIVTRSISSLVKQLAKGEPLSGHSKIDPKHGVLPQGKSDSEQVDFFIQTIEAHQNSINDLPRLRGTDKTPHPLFGNFDAHQWNCMLSFHLKVHRRQANTIAEMAKST